MSNQDTKHFCPQCGTAFEKVYTVPAHFNKEAGGFPAFVTVSARRGMEAFGPYSVPKTVVCHNDGLGFTHFKFDESGEEHLVQYQAFTEEALYVAQKQWDDNPQLCQHEENGEKCARAGWPCRADWTDIEPREWFCESHCNLHGYCKACNLSAEPLSEDGYCMSCEESDSENLEEEDEEGPSGTTAPLF